MKPFDPQILKGSRGSTFVGTLVAAAIIVCSIGGIGTSFNHLGKAMKKAEVTNLAVAVEANLVSSLHSKENFPDPVAGANSGGSQNISPNPGLRAGTLTSLPITTSFGTFNVPIQTTGTEPGFIGFLDRNFADCPAGFSDSNCILRYEVRLKKTGTNSYSFSYQIDGNPDVLEMASLGNAANFDSPIDPGNYRADTFLTHCDPANDLFMTGMNRDTGEAYCAEKPRVAKCPDGRIPKGLNYVRYVDGDPKAGTLVLECTSAPLRTFNCPDNYTLQQFNPQYADPENTKFDQTVPGTCVFRTGHQTTMPGKFPAQEIPYMKSVSGTFCPPFYSAGGDSACHLVPNKTRNNSSSEGLGLCAKTANKDCKREVYTYTSDQGKAYLAWKACITGVAPPGGCGSEPANPVIVKSCSQIETSPDCNGIASTRSSCETPGSWSLGTEYATGIYTVAPTAVPEVTFMNRDATCTFRDTSPICKAPPLDYNGKTWGMKQAKWYGGVQISGLTCTFDPSQGSAETVNAF